MKNQDFNWERFRKGNSIRTEYIRNALVSLRGWKCEKCQLDKWQDKEIPLQIHHIDGDHLNNEISNLQLLCPNCHAQTNNFAGRNKKGIHISDEQLCNTLKESYSIREAWIKLGIKNLNGWHYDRSNELITRYNISLLQKPANKQKKEKEIKIEKPKRYCIICGKELTSKQKKYCSQECSHITQHRADKPNRKELKQLIRTQPFTQIGKLYKVSDNAIRKWCDCYSLPRTKSEINKYSDEEWKDL